MKNITWIAAVIVISLAKSAMADIEATLFRVEESRSTTLIKDHIGRPKDSLTIQVSLKGPEADTAFRYGDVKLDVAVDDEGRNLIPKNDPLDPADKYKEFQNCSVATLDSRTEPSNLPSYYC